MLLITDCLTSAMVDGLWVVLIVFYS